MDTTKDETDSVFSLLIPPVLETFRFSVYFPGFCTLIDVHMFWGNDLSNAAVVDFDVCKL